MPVKSRVQIFGREPAFWIGLIEALLAVLLSWSVFGIDVDIVAGIMAVVVALSGVYVAYVTRDTMLGVLVGLAKAVIICLSAFQINLTDAQTTSVIALVAILGSVFNRSQTAPAVRPSFRDPTLPADEVPQQVHVEVGGDEAAYRAAVSGEVAGRRVDRGAGEVRLLLVIAAAVLVALLIWSLL